MTIEGGRRESVRRTMWRGWMAAVVGAAVLLGAAPAAEAQPGAASSADVQEAVRLHGEVSALHQAGKYDAAIPLARRVLALLEKALGPDHPDVATALNDVAVMYEAKGEYVRVEPLYQRALAIREKALGPDHLAVAASLNNLALLYVTRGQYDRTEPLLLRALAIKEKALGPNHPDVALSLGSLAGFYHKTSMYGRAEPLYQRALAIQEKALGPAHPDVALSLNNLALLYEQKGEYGRAEPLKPSSLAIRAHALGPANPGVAISLNNLAALYEKKGEYGRVEPLLLRALSIKEKALGPNHPDVATALNNLALLYATKGQYDRALQLYQRSLAIREKALGPDHPEVATSLGNLAELYRKTGDSSRAEPLYQRAMAIQDRALGPDHPDLTRHLSNLALMYWAAGRLPEAIQVLTRAQDAEEKMLGRVVAGGSEAQKRAYLATLTGQTQAPVTLALETRSPQAARLALTTQLRRKGRALDATASGLSTLRARLGPEEQKLLDELDAARAQYVTLVLQGPGANPLAAYRTSLERLDEQIRQRESAISARSSAFRVEQQPITVEAIQAVMPEDAALVEWVAYQPFNLKARSESEKWALPRYAACVLPRHGDPVWTDLGDEKSINEEVQAVRAALRRPANTEVSNLAGYLDVRIMAPVRSLLGGARRILLSPDGALNLVPFAALVGEDNRPLIERFSFTYLTSGRDLLRLAVPTPTRGAPLVLAAPEFDADSARPGAGRFLPLLHADEEAATVARLFPDTTVLLHRDATKQSLREAHGPRLLHIGTHGYFEPTVCMTDPRRASEAQTKALGNPLLHSGIALAGANACASGHDEGLLTAFEASGLDLYGTKLVVLSACQTGVGDATAGDGVYGLRRALVLAGAETQVMSLWPVDGAATDDLMKAYYGALAKGGRRSESMRGVQLAMLHDKRWEHPYYWAGFIVSGDDRRLDENVQPPDLRVHPGGACLCRSAGEAPGGSMPWLAAAAALGVWVARQRSS